ncbi:hypothetical protein SAPIO_CDS0301 [Scedosporium apiospermum]|uniref:Invertebrate defensins family profile domain-containing protein n=1 Tax=Pseudallescheria apiosperma TaxID=563466 RepID=A0A084GHY6_PSEDA|nr:uncharacterized protein SAPIO_CDS0301 [Scedosporium apiospermum]KEZ46948.1 hypothetical protein SAPIO_CDS0301 [Scedosporium apiospermum]
MAAPATDSVASVDANSPSEIDSLIAQLVALVETEQTPAAEARDVELEARAGFTCAFLGGNAGCQVKCFLLKGTGGYCNSKNICTCY